MQDVRGLYAGAARLPAREGEWEWSRAKAAAIGRDEQEEAEQ